MKLLSTQMFNFLFALLLVLPSTLLATDEAPTLKEIVEKSDVENCSALHGSAQPAIYPARRGRPQSCAQTVDRR